MGPAPLFGPQWVRRKLGSKSEGESPRCCRCSARAWMGPCSPKEPHGGRENPPANGGALRSTAPASPVGLACLPAPHAPRSRSGARSGPSNAYPPTNYHPGPLRRFLAHPSASMAPLPGAPEPCGVLRRRWRWVSWRSTRSSGGRVFHGGGKDPKEGGRFSSRSTRTRIGLYGPCCGSY